MNRFKKYRSNIYLISLVALTVIALVFKFGVFNDSPEIVVEPIEQTTTQELLNTVKIANLEAQFESYQATTQSNLNGLAEAIKNNQPATPVTTIDRTATDKLSTELAALQENFNRSQRDSGQTQVQITNLHKLVAELQEALLYHTDNTTIHGGAE